MSHVLTLISSILLVLCPYTKVEESFNMQAMHDIIYHRQNISMYDHNEFPGVVPRSFIGPLIITFIASPVAFAIQYLDYSKIFTQYIVRVILGSLVVNSWSCLNETLKKYFGKTFSWWYTVLVASQFHFLFYMTRPLPNIMALPLVLQATEAYLSFRYIRFIFLSGAAIIIFRAELALLFGMFLLHALYLRQITIAKVVKVAIPSAVVLVLVTVAVDSYFWGRIIWPEAEVFYFNTILNKSSDWGTSPLLWYFYSAIPRGIGPSLLLLPLGLWFDRRTWLFAAPALLYVGAFSLLPHKELRFIIYVFPLLNVPIASACTYIFNRRNKQVYHVLFWLVVGCLLGNYCLGIFVTVVSRLNYPGGVAITRFHNIRPNETYVHLHIDNLAAQTGVTRFTQQRPEYRYSKNETLTSDQLQTYTHLLVEAKSKYSRNLKPYIQTHRILDAVDTFSHYTYDYSAWPPVRIKTKLAIFILERKDYKNYPYGIDLDLSGERVKSDDVTEEDDLKSEEILNTSAEISESEDIFIDSSNENLQFDDIQVTASEEILTYEEQIQGQTNEVQNDRPQLTIMSHEVVDENNIEHKILEKELEEDIVNIQLAKIERKQRAIDKIRSETKNKVTASAKQKLKDIINRHKTKVIETELREEEIDDIIVDADAMDASNQGDNDNVLAETVETSFVNISDDTENSTNETAHKLDVNTFVNEETIEGIVDEVIAKLYEKKMLEERYKSEEITFEDRQYVHQLVEDIVKERIRAHFEEKNSQTNK